MICYSVGHASNLETRPKHSAWKGAVHRHMKADLSTILQLVNVYNHFAVVCSLIFGSI